MNRQHLFKGVYNSAMTFLNVLIFLLGLFMLGPGLWAAVDAIVITYAGGTQSPFTCADNGL